MNFDKSAGIYNLEEHDQFNIYLNNFISGLKKDSGFSECLNNATGF